MMSIGLMTRGRVALGAALVMATIAASAVAAGPASAAVSDFYAAPYTSDSASCTQADPCSLSTALTDASSDGDTVHLAPGVYGFANEPVQYTITHAITIEGVPGVDDTGNPTRAVIESDRGPVITVDDPTGTVNIQDVEVQDLGGSDTNAALELDSAATVDRVVAQSADGTACKVTADAVQILDSLCDSTSQFGTGADVEEGSATMTTTLRNDTIIESGSNSYGLTASSVFGALTVDVTNTIVSGGAVSISVFGSEPSSSTTVNADHSNYDGASTLIAPCCGQGAATLRDGGGNQTSSPPDFRNAGVYDFRETATSPTVDAGTDAGNGTLDLEGSPRSHGAAPDIGAYEYVPAPSVTTTDATAGRTTATINGSADPNGIETHVWFDYWPASNILQSQATPPVDAGAGQSGVPATASLTGLQPATVYDYIAVAASAGGVVEALSTGTFTTTDVPTVSTGASSGVDETTATVSGTVTPNGLDTTYAVKYGTAPDALTSTAAGGDAGAGTTSQDVTVALSNLQPASTYYYRVVASNSDGDSSNTDTRSFTTSTPPAVVAAAPSAVGRTTATLGASIDPKGSNTDYHFEYRPAGSSGSYAQTAGGIVSAGSPSDVSATVTTLQPATTYEWRIVATHGMSGSETVSGANFRTTDVPAAVTGASSSVGQRQATVSGTVNPNGADATWSVQYGTAPGMLTSNATGGDAGAGTTPRAVSATLTGLSPATTYYYRIVASNGDGSSTNNGTADFTTVGASQPAPRVPTASPMLTGLRIAPRVFAGDRRPSPTISYRDSQAARTTFRVERALPGVRRGKRCVAPPKHGPEHGSRCTRLTAVRGSFTHADVAGIDRLPLSATRLAPGNYVLIASPRNAAGIVGPSVSTAFRVLPERSRDRSRSGAGHGSR